MRKLIITLTIFIFSFCGFAHSARVIDLEPITPEDRILILAPHPDDEALGCAGIIQEALKKKARLKITYLTNGDHNQLAFIVYEKKLVLRKSEFIRLGEIRRQEAQSAMALLGLSQDNLVFLGYPDFGTFSIFTRYWKADKPFKSMLTRLNKVPYKDNFSYGKYFIPENILADLVKIIGAYKPNKIFVSHPADTNGDHRAFYLFLNIALWKLEGKIPEPKVYTYMIHYADWPLPRRYHPRLEMIVPENLKDLGRWFSFALGREETENKHKAINEYKSQILSSGFYLSAFARTNELFQEIPRLNITSQSPQLIDGFAEYAIKNNNLEISLKHPAAKYDISRMSIYLFGWRENIPFADMPKIFLKIRANNIAVFDGRKRVKYEGVQLLSQGQDALVRVPLAILNNPHKVLISARIFSKHVPFIQSIWIGVVLGQND